jgi:integrase/recombinase XerD
MTHKTDLPQPIEDTTPSPQVFIPEADSLVAVYLRTLTSPQTIKTYNTELTLFISFLEEMGKGLGDLTAEDISLYREHLIGVYAAATAAKKLAVLRRFLIFTYMAGATTVNPESLRFFAKSPRVRQDPAYNVLTEEELSRMLNTARASNYRDYVMLAVMAGCGLREAEIVRLRIGDFREAGAEQVFLRILGKGNKVRNVSISPDLWRLIQRYVLLTERTFTSYLDSRKPIFTSRVGKDKPLTTRSVQNIVKKYVRAAGITKAIAQKSSPHERINIILYPYSRTAQPL